MQFFTWGINKPGVGDKRAELVNEHWDFLDKYEDTLIARGPTLDWDDTSIVTGSIHILELDDWETAEEFVYQEPFAKNGLFEEIMLKEFTLGLDRNQFAFKSNPDHQRFFIHCPAKPGAAEQRVGLRDDHRQYMESFDENFVCRGALRADDGTWDGSVFFLEFPSDRDVGKFLKDEPYAKAGLFEKTDVHRWTMGGRKNLSPKGGVKS